MFLSLDQVAKYFPSCDHATHLTSFSCPSRVDTHSYSFPEFSQRDVVPSKLEEAIIFPVGSQSTDLIDFTWPSARIAYYEDKEFALLFN